MQGEGKCCGSEETSGETVGVRAGDGHRLEIQLARSRGSGTKSHLKKKHKKLLG